MEFWKCWLGDFADGFDHGVELGEESACGGQVGRELRRPHVERCIDRAEDQLMRGEASLGVDRGVVRHKYPWEYVWLRPCADDALVVDDRAEVPDDDLTCTFDAVRFVAVDETHAMRDAEPGVELRDDVGHKAGSRI